LTLLFLKLYSHDNYIPRVLTDEHFRLWCSDLFTRIGKINNEDIEKIRTVLESKCPDFANPIFNNIEKIYEESVSEKFDKFIHWLYFGLLHRRFSNNFNVGCRLLKFPWKWDDKGLLQVCKAMSTPSQGNDTTLQSCKDWNYENLNNRPK